MNVLEVTNLTKRFGEVDVVDQVSFTLKANTATALIGPNGAGKTTTLSMLTTLLMPTSGNIIMPGVVDLRKEIGFLPQYPQFFSWMTAKKYVEMAANLNDVPKQEVKKCVEETLAFVGLEQAMHKKIQTFSGGMKQRLGIAQAIIHRPKLLLLDEPVSALDPVGRREIMELLKKLQRETTILYSTHILNDAEQMTDQLLFLKDGKLVEQGLLTDIQQKYAKQAFLITFATEQAATTFLNTCAFTQFVQQENVVQLVKNEQLQTMQQLLQLLVAQAIPVIKVEEAATSLEDIFMKVVAT
jgi:ABC-2 type transport system ATP-binding protein